MYSDNGTTFHGANRELSDAYARAILDPNFRNRLATSGTVWHFLLLPSPHFGDLWETGVKIVKHHLKRCIGLHALTFEEMFTLLCRIEAYLNSPIAPVFDNLDDYNPRRWTPGHFLVRTFFIAPAEPSVLDLIKHFLDSHAGKWSNVQLNIFGKLGPAIICITCNNAPNGAWSSDWPKSVISSSYLSLWLHRANGNLVVSRHVILVMIPVWYACSL